MTSSTRRAVVAGHGDFAAGLVSAVAQITGRDDVFAALSNRGLSGAEIEGAMRAALAAAETSVIFTDLPAGSCTLAARRIQRERADVVLVAGANVATLLDFVFDSSPSAEDAARQAAERGRAALLVIGTPGAAHGG